MKQLYLCGAISNNPNYKQDFENARKRLIEADYGVMSPVIFCKEGWDRSKCMRKCLAVIAKNENLSIALIESDHKSRGQDLELSIAQALGLEIKTVDEWVEAEKMKEAKYWSLANSEISLSNNIDDAVEAALLEAKEYKKEISETLSIAGYELKRWM